MASVVAGVVAGWCCGAAAADTGSVRAGVGAQVWGLVEGGCRQDGDVVECASPTLFADFFLEGRWRAIDALSVGLNVGYGFSGGTAELQNSDGSGTRFETRMVRASLEPRLHLSPQSAVDFFVGVDLGVMWIQEGLVEFQGDSDTHTSSGAQSGPLAGANAGLVIPLWSGLELEFGLRAAFVSLPAQNVPELEPNRYATEFGQQLWLSGWLGLGWQFPALAP